MLRSIPLQRFLALRLCLSTAVPIRPSRFPSTSEKPDKRAEKSKIVTLIQQGQIPEALADLQNFERTSAPGRSVHLSLRVGIAAQLLRDGADQEAAFAVLDDVRESQTASGLADDQFMSLLGRLSSAAATELYRKIVTAGWHRKRNRDAIMAVVLGAWFREFDGKVHTDVSEVINAYNRLAEAEPELTEQQQLIRQKIHPACFYAIIIGVNKAAGKGAKKMLQPLMSHISKHGSKLQATCFTGLWPLHNGKGLVFFDEAQRRGDKFTVNHAKYLAVIAEAAKQSRILEVLLEYPQFIANTDAIIGIVESVILIAGKKNDIGTLEAVTEKIAKMYRATPTEFHATKFRKALRRIAHFYKCYNMAAPEKLMALIEKARTH